MWNPDEDERKLKPQKSYAEQERIAIQEESKAAQPELTQPLKTGMSEKTRAQLNELYKKLDAQRKNNPKLTYFECQLPEEF